MTSEEEATCLLKEYREKSARSKKLRGDDEMVEPDVDEERYRVLLEDKVVVLGDYGTEFSAIPHRVVEDVAKVCPDAVVKDLEAPLNSNLAFDTKSEVI